MNLLYSENTEIIIDYEKYFCFSNDEIPGNSGFYTNDINKCPDKVRFKGKEKFPKKILVWVALSSRGISEPLIGTSKSESIDQYRYLTECLQKRLLPFIQNYHQNQKYLFWPDLASAHYSNSCIAWMNENINFVERSINPPNVPQARPIENFWGDLSNKVYENGWEAKTEHQLVCRIKEKLKEFTVQNLQNHM